MFDLKKTAITINGSINLDADIAILRDAFESSIQRYSVDVFEEAMWSESDGLDRAEMHELLYRAYRAKQLGQSHI